MISPLATVLSLVTFATTTWAEGTFVFPQGPDGVNIFYLGQKINITWTGMTDYPVFSLAVVQATNQTQSWLIGNSEDHPTRYEWTVDVDQLGFDLNDSRLFSFYACNGSDATGNAFSLPFGTNRFIVRDQDDSPSTTSSALAPQPTPTAPTTTAASATDPATAPHTPAELSTGAKAGIAIGVVLIAGLIIGAIAWFLLRKRKTKYSTKSAEFNEKKPTQRDFSGYSSPAQLHADPLRRLPAELDSFASPRYR